MAQIAEKRNFLVRMQCIQINLGSDYYELSFFYVLFVLIIIELKTAEPKSLRVG